jgi:hypothetical protein
MTTTASNSAAHEVLRRAHERGYHFPQNFAGFSATIRYIHDNALFTGTLEVHSPGKIQFNLDADAQELSWLRREIGSLCGHRWYAPYEEGDGRYELELSRDEHHPSGDLITFHSDPYNSSYRVRDGAIKQVNRTLGNQRFSINIQAHTPIREGLFLPAYFTVMFWSVEDTRLLRTAIYHDRYIEVGNVFLPAQRQVLLADDAGQTIRHLELSEHRVLGGTPSEERDFSAIFTDQQESGSEKKDA